MIVGLVVLNGLSPYLELKSGFGFNMYSNLVTVGGETNHFLVPGTAELRSSQSETAVILASVDGEQFDLERAGDHPEWIEPLPWYLERFLPFRAVSTVDPPRCQPSFLPAD